MKASQAQMDRLTDATIRLSVDAPPTLSVYSPLPQKCFCPNGPTGPTDVVVRVQNLYAKIRIPKFVSARQTVQPGER